MQRNLTRGHQIALHLFRIATFAGIVAAIHASHARLSARLEAARVAGVDLDRVRRVFPDARRLEGRGGERVEILDAKGGVLGFYVETSPKSDSIVGFSGPTNVWVVFSPDDHVVHVGILSSGDTREHLEQVLEDGVFLRSFVGKTWDELARSKSVDGVSGATLTSLAIRESVVYRLSGARPSLRFPEPVTLVEAKLLFPGAVRIEQDASRPSRWVVLSGAGVSLGSLLRTAPHADNLVGYQGPTEALVGFGVEGRVVGVAIAKTYDNEEYVAYVREDEHFRTVFNDLVLEEVAALDLEDAGVEGVSGATMTSRAVAESVVLAASQELRSSPLSESSEAKSLRWRLRDLGTGIVVVVGLVLAFTPLRRRRLLRILFQAVLIVYLGLINGDMLSQAMIVGWARSGVPWQSAGGLVLLTLAAFLVPITTKRNVYCSHLCPHGAVQDWLRGRLPWRVQMPRRLARVLGIVPALLLLWVVLVASIPIAVSLIGIEPFDAWVFWVAGAATISVAAVGLVASMFVPMAYCRFGCPTGALLGFLRFQSRNDRWTTRDGFAVLLLVLAWGLGALVA